MSNELALMHYGTKGMKWGIRKGKKETGVSRARGAAIDRAYRRSDRKEKKAEIQKKLALRLGVETKGAGGISLREAKESRAKAQRLAKGKETVSEKFEMAVMSINVASLVYERKPR